jgi:hypothetical protein
MALVPESKLILAVAHQRLCASYGSFPYSRLWRAVVTSVIAAERIGSRWVINEADLPRVAETLGLTSQQLAA